MAAEKRKRKVSPVKNHQILSCVYAFFQSNHEKIGYSVRNIEVTESGTYRITAVNNDFPSNLFRILKILVAENTDLITTEDFDESFMREDSESEGRNILVERIIAVREEGTESRKEDAPFLVPVSVWAVNCEEGTITKASGNEADRELDMALQSGVQNTFSNYPVPYVNGMDPVVGLSFLTLNFTVRGWHPYGRILNDAHRYALKYSPFVDGERVVEELTSLLKACVKIGLITEKGDKIFLPRTRARSESTFSRKYREYLSRLMKKTLYDFGSTL